jgi:hypothetical protein
MSSFNFGKCANCRFAERTEQQLECRAHPPQLTYFLAPVPGPAIAGQQRLGAQGLAGWPAVQPDHWCGAFQTKIQLAS